VFVIESSPLRAGPHFQHWLDLLQRAAEETGQMGLDVQELDDFVPAQVLAEFAETAMEGYRSINVHVGTS
jgi:hypothetical protein